MRWLAKQSGSFKKKAEKIFKHACIKEKHTIAPAEVIFSTRTFEERNNLYKQKAIELGAQAMAKALSEAGIQAKEIDCLITTSCTGYMIPSPNAYVANKLDLRSDVWHLPVTSGGYVVNIDQGKPSNKLFNLIYNIHFYHIAPALGKLVFHRGEFNSFVLNARMAEKYSVGRIFLADDATHVTPPFVGQGLASGIRDAHNLAWKLSYVLKGFLVNLCYPPMS
ncbi:MAG: FAD-dependent monooxygenase [Deltaproteobacteria bacterium]|nr:FAD-dependent monooxygenase [Deltaproteobacteria bacterium]